MTIINIFTENIYQDWKLNEKDIIKKTHRMLEYYISELGTKSCLAKQEFESITLDIVFCDSTLRIRAPERIQRIRATRSTVYPGFPTDAGPLLIASLIKAHGTSTFVETIFENRFNYIDELRRLGADIKVHNRVAIVEGVKNLYGAHLCCTDLRGGAAAVILALAAEGVSCIDKIHHIERGYEKIDENLAGVLANIKKG